MSVSDPGINSGVSGGDYLLFDVLVDPGLVLVFIIADSCQLVSNTFFKSLIDLFVI